MTPAPENDLNRALADRAERFAREHGDLSMEQVLSRAGEIRRGRRMKASMLMAAVVLAVAVPVGVTVINNDDAPNGRPINPATSAPTQAPSILPEPDRSPLTLGDLPTGDAPRSAYYADGKLYGGPKPVELPGDQNVNAVARITGGFLVSRPGETSWEVDFITDAGVAQGDGTWTTDGGFAVSPNGNVGAFVQPDGTVIAVQADGSFQLPKIPEGSGFDAVAVLVSAENCGPASSEICTVTAVSRGEEPATWSATFGARAEKLTGAASAFQSVSSINAQGLIAGMTSVDDNGSCWEVRSPGDGARLFETCEHSLLEFSPDGRHLLATTSYRDGFADPYVAVLDLQGKVLLNLTGVVTASTWEDDEHLLVRIFDPETGRWGVLRVGMDGNREYAFGPVKGSDADPPIVFGER